MTTTKGKNVTLTDTDGKLCRYRISYLRTGWHVTGEGIDQLVPTTDVFFPTAANIVNAAYAN